MFDNRQQAGRLLSRYILEILESEECRRELPVIVVALPRGGVPVAREVALALDSPMTILVAKKIGAPFQPELAIGAVSSDGNLVLNEELLSFTKKLDRFIKAQSRRLIAVSKEKEERWLRESGRVRLDLKGKLVIVVDDGIATGMTTGAALQAVRAREPARVILAAPIIGYSAMQRLQKYCDMVISLITPSDFQSIGQFYTDFSQLSDESVTEILKGCPYSPTQQCRTVG